jgi:hypothetical protein
VKTKRWRTCEIENGLSNLASGGAQSGLVMIEFENELGILKLNHRGSQFFRSSSSKQIEGKPGRSSLERHKWAAELGGTASDGQPSPLRQPEAEGGTEDACAR